MKRFLLHVILCVMFGVYKSAYADNTSHTDQLPITQTFDVTKDNINRPDIQHYIAFDFSQAYPPGMPLTNYPAHRSNGLLSVLTLKIALAGTVGGHLGWAYNKSSIEKMSKMFSPKDVPGLLQLFSRKEGSTTGIEFAIASQCRAGLEGLLMSVHDKSFHKLNGRMLETSIARNIITQISESSVCDEQVQQDALGVLTSIDNFDMPAVKYYLPVNYTNKGIKTLNNYQGDPGGYIACHSHSDEGSTLSVDSHFIGRIRVKGHYTNKTFQPFDEQKNLDRNLASINLCEHYFPSCKSEKCRVSYNTGDWFGL